MICLPSDMYSTEINCLTSSTQLFIYVNNVNVYIFNLMRATTHRVPIKDWESCGMLSHLFGTFHR